MVELTLVFVIGEKPIERVFALPTISTSKKLLFWPSAVFQVKSHSINTCLKSPKLASKFGWVKRKNWFELGSKNRKNNTAYMHLMDAKSL